MPRAPTTIICSARRVPFFFKIFFFYVFVLTASAAAYTRHTYTNCVCIICTYIMTRRVLYEQPPLPRIILLYYDKILHIIHTLTRNDEFSSYLYYYHYYYARCIFYFQFFFSSVIWESVKRKGTEMIFFAFQLRITDLEKKSTTEDENIILFTTRVHNTILN